MMLNVESGETPLRELLEAIVQAIAKKTPRPEIQHIPSQALFTLKVDPHDQGRFIGKLGATIWAIQTIFWFAGMTHFGWSYSIKLLDHPLTPRQPVPVKFKKNWDRKKIEKLVASIMGATLRSFASYSLSEEDDTNLTVSLKLMEYLRYNLEEPNFVEAFTTVMKAAGYSNGVHIKTEACYA